MTRTFFVLSLLGITACGLGDRTQVVLPPDGLALDSTGAIKRRYLADSLVLLSTLGGGSDRDTSLLDPYILEAGDNGAYLVEGDQQVQAYDTLLNRLWVIGQNGSGPGEFRNIRDLKISPEREIWVHDPSNARLTRISAEGTVRGFISEQRVGHSEPMIPGPNRTAILLPPYADADILVVDTNGNVIERDSVRWSGFRQLETLSRQFETANDPATNRWVMGFSFGNGWFAYEGHGGSERRYYVEPTQFPGVVKEVSDGGATVATRMMRGDLSGANLSLLGDTVFVLFGGKEKPRQVVDLYNFTSGKYLGSISLPEPADDIAITGHLLYTLTSVPGPKVSVYRRLSGH